MVASDPVAALRVFFEAWAPEFEKSILTSTGAAVRVELGEGPAATVEGAVWQGQVFERGNTGSAGSVWIGTPAETLAALTAGSDDARESRYRKILRQSFECAARMLSSRGSEPILCDRAIEDSAPPPEDLSQMRAGWIAVGERRLPFYVWIEAAQADWLEAPGALVPRVAPVTQASHAFDRLADLRLPVSVVLGKSRIPIREVLKLTAGSLVELDHDIGDPVEVVVHNAVVARGEVVSVAGNYGVRIQEVISRGERLALQRSTPGDRRGSRGAPAPVEAP